MNKTEKKKKDSGDSKPITSKRTTKKQNKHQTPFSVIPERLRGPLYLVTIFLGLYAVMSVVEKAFPAQRTTLKDLSDVTPDPIPDQISRTLAQINQALSDDDPVQLYYAVSKLVILEGNTSRSLYHLFQSYFYVNDVKHGVDFLNAV